MNAPAGTFLGKRVWHRLEKSAVRSHERDLLRRLRALTAERPVVLDATGSWAPGALSLQLSGRRLLLGGVDPSAAWAVLAMAYSPPALQVVKGGRYGKLWWVAVATRHEEQVVLATHFQLLRDPGRPQESELDLPVLSGAF